MILIPKAIGGTLEVYAPSRPAAGPTLEVRASTASVQPSGYASTATLVSAGTAATLDSVNTTISAGVAKTAESVVVASAANIVAGRRYLLGTESVQVASLSGTTVYLKRPTIAAHASADTFVGTRISYALSASETATEYDDCWAVFSWSVGGVAQPPIRIDFTISRGYVTNPITPDELRVTDPLLVAKVSKYTDLQAICDLAFDETIERLRAVGMSVQDLVGASNRIKPAVRYLALYTCAEQFGADYEQERARLMSRFESLLAVFSAKAPVDEDRNDAVERREQGRPRGGMLSRG